MTEIKSRIVIQCNDNLLDDFMTPRDDNLCMEEHEIHPLHKAFGLRLAQIRLSKRLTQTQLAKLCGWESQSRISQYEIGERTPSLPDIEHLAKQLGVPPCALAFGVSEDMFWVRVLSDLPEEHKKALLAGLGIHRQIIKTKGYEGIDRRFVDIPVKRDQRTTQRLTERREQAGNNYLTEMERR